MAKLPQSRLQVHSGAEHFQLRRGIGLRVLRIRGPMRFHTNLVAATVLG